MQPANKDFPNNHEIFMLVQPNFLENYIARCSSCKVTLFELHKVVSLMIWNGVNFLILNSDNQQPGSLIIDDKEKVQMSGPRAHNIYVDVLCGKCNQNMGLFIKAPFYRCAMLKRKILIEVVATRCYIFKNQKFIKMKIEEIFQPENFQKVQQIEERRSKKREEQKEKEEQNQNQLTLREGSKKMQQIQYPNQQKEEQILKQELKMGVEVFSQVLRKLQKRILSVQEICQKFDKIVNLMTDKVQFQDSDNPIPS